LNDHLLVGPNLQKDIFSLLVHFRQYQYALSADVVKMFRQIWISQKHWKYQKVLWRSDPSEPLSTYYLHTLTYGTASAPYLAMKCLQQLAHEFAEKFPHASKVLSENMYMDDILTGTNTLEDAITLRDNVINVLDKGGFALAKWSSNDDSILSGLPTTNNSIIPLDSNASTKTLGLSLNCKRDILKYNIKINPKTNQITKRTILSTIASIYDPLSLLSPIFVEAKLILQKLWQLKCDWDDSLPSDIEQSFKVFFIKFTIHKRHRNSQKGHSGISI
jgi:hypothetical protein